MIKTINSDLIRGHIDTIILSVLHESDRYGYDILGEIEKKSGGEYVLKQPTLYSCLKRLESQGFIYKYWGTETNGGRRTYYSLTDMGKELFLKNKTDWRYSRTVIDRLISTADDPITSIQIKNLSNESNDEELSTSAVINEQTSPSVNENNFDESEIKNEVVYTLVEEKAQSESYDAHEQVSSNEKNDENIDNNIEDNIAIQENYLNVIADAEKDEIFSEKTTSSIDTAKG